MADTVVSPGRQDLALVRTRSALDNAHGEIAKHQDTINFLLGQVHDKVGPTISTGITLASSAAAGFLDGFLGPNNNKIGPVPITLVAGISSAVAAFWTEDPNTAEAFAAVSRGFAAPSVYTLTERATARHFQRDVPRGPADHRQPVNQPKQGTPIA